METEETLSMKEVCSRVNRLQSKLDQVQGTVFFLEAEVLALGNILIKHGILTLKELEQFTSVIVKQKMAQRETEKNNPMKVLQEEFEDALQEKIKQ